MENNQTGFYGQFRTTMDNQGRLSLPAKLRSVRGEGDSPILSQELILAKGLEGCLSLYSPAEWESVQARLSSLHFTKKDFRFFTRRLYSSAASVTPDKNGRIQIPSHLMEEAGLKKELMVIGVNRWIEIWNPERYEYYLEQYSGSYEEVAERLFSGDENKPQ
ncbi:MAG: division/cell wall cluster transcriptional repressor MraZ [Candidatus Zixiibacteriota bacterium]